MEMKMRRERLAREHRERRERDRRRREERAAAAERRFTVSPTRPQILTVRAVHQLPPTERRLKTIAEDGKFVRFKAQLNTLLAASSHVNGGKRFNETF